MEPQTEKREAPPLSVAATLGWGAIALGVFFWLSESGARLLPADSASNSAVTVACQLATVGIVAIAVRRAGWSLASYTSLEKPRTAHLALGVGGQLALTLIFAAGIQLAATNVIGQGNAPDAVFSSNLAALAAFWAAYVVIGPVSEEIFWRGFIYRGLAASWIGPLNTIVLVSLAFMLLHFATDGSTRLWHLACGLLFGTLRYVTGSLSAPIAAHALGNGIAASFQ